MNQIEIQAIRDSWARIAPNGERIAELFYAHLFLTEPQLKSLFEGTNMIEQRRKLVAALALVVTSLENPSALRPLLEALGERHHQYGVRPEHYHAVGASLIATLREGLGADFTPTALSAWQGAYGTIAKIMQGGVQTAPIEPRD